MKHENEKKRFSISDLKNSSLSMRIQNSYNLTIKYPVILGTLMLLLAFFLFISAGISADNANIFSKSSLTRASVPYYQSMVNKYLFQAGFLSIFGILLFGLAFFKNKKL